MTDYEHIVISAVRYALGRMTYIVSTTVGYVLKDIEQNKLSEQCLKIIENDIKGCKNYGMDCDKVEWLKLLNKIKEVLNNENSRRDV